MEFRRREKNKAYIVTAVDRATHTIVGWAVCGERTLEILQLVIDSAPPATDYYTDGFLMYQDLSYWGNHTMLKDKSQTYSVEGGNADLQPLGIGTQRVEATLQAHFPEARILRVDRDSTRNKGTWNAMRKQIQEDAVDILVS